MHRRQSYKVEANRKGATSCDSDGVKVELVKRSTAEVSSYSGHEEEVLFFIRVFRATQSLMPVSLDGFALVSTTDFKALQSIFLIVFLIDFGVPLRR